LILGTIRAKEDVKKLFARIAEEYDRQPSAQSTGLKSRPKISMVKCDDIYRPPM
jgi:ubiquinone/menaquinone biosynthesis C-methylase UbiE